MKSKKSLALILAALLMFSLLPASALAANEEKAQPKELSNDSDSTIYNAGDVVYNNGGVVYNNAGTVYNNGGIVYNNAGTAYNNAGIVYNNGGTVYNNDGSVYNNSGVVYSHGGSVQEVGAEGQTPTATPTFSAESGTYGSGFDLEISAAQGAAIYYTLDGTAPDTESSEYKGSISVEKGMKVQAIAVAQGALPSETVSADYSLPELTTPVFEAAEEGYKQPKEQALKVVNDGPTDAVIASLALGGESAEAFVLNTTEGGVVPAGDTDDTTWTLRPAKGLEKGAYSASLTVKFDSGDTTVLFVSFKVK